ncbi:MAG: homocysteine biosynthesis protein [Spirochaetales bacterium]|nr:homocysteine biosynthesis protein [Spirochaetales bacterium]
MKTYREINEKIEKGKAVVLTAEEIISYTEKHGTAKAAKDVDVVTTATFGPMCSSGCFLNFGHSKPKMRITEAWLDDVLVYSGIAAVDAYLGATQLRHNDPANTYYPGEFRFGGAHVIEKLIRGDEVQLFALSYGTDDYPRREIRTYLTIDDLNQAIMVNPRNCYQNYNAAINTSDKPIYTYFGKLKPDMKNLIYCSAGQLSPLLNDPFYDVIGIGTSVWLSGARGHVYAEGTQHSPVADRARNGVPREGAGTLALTADMKKMDPRYVRAISLRGYGVSLALGVGIPLPVLNEKVIEHACVKDEDLYAPVIDYSWDYPQKTGKVLAHISYSELKTGSVMIKRKEVPTGSISSYALALEIAERLKAEIKSGDFLLSAPSEALDREKAAGGLQEKAGRKK